MGAESYRTLFGNISSHFGGYVEPCRGYVGSKTDQNLTPSRGAQIFSVFLPENRFQRPPWNFIVQTFSNRGEDQKKFQVRPLDESAR